jgi:hypothetical protein
MLWFDAEGGGSSGPPPRKHFRAPQGALQIPHFVRDDKGGARTQVRTVAGGGERLGYQTIRLSIKIAILKIGIARID